MSPVIIFLLVMAFLVVTGSFFVIRQQTIGIIERFGKFNNVAAAGLNFKLPFIDRVVARVNMRVLQLDVVVETKTIDDVFVDVKVSVQYQVMPDKVYEAYYRLTNIHDQISAYVFDVVRARVPQLRLDDVFSKKEDIAVAVKHELHDTMDDFGYDIIKALVTDIDPDEKVKHAMNEINAATRMRMAASEKGEADRILKVKAAEAEAQSKALEGKGIADQRKAIIEGLHTSVIEFQQSLQGVSAQDVMMIVLLTQYFDTLKDVAHHSQTNTLMLPSNPGGLTGFNEQIRDVIVSANLISNEPTKV
ncbi:MAG: SPFH domain-containing protein [Sphingobacteriales bacterium]|nr:SPFH domain-containing protein [Sphingobacteriales bacterium]MCC7223555.1 SPFH domain-containing protein [Chitinophagales bacterium]